MLASIATLDLDGFRGEGDFVDFGQVIAQLCALDRLDHQCRSG